MSKHSSKDDVEGHKAHDAEARRSDAHERENPAQADAEAQHEREPEPAPQPFIPPKGPSEPEPVPGEPKPPPSRDDPDREAARDVQGPLTEAAEEHPTPPGPLEGPPGEPVEGFTPLEPFPDFKAISKGQVGGFGIEALEAYRYGERNRYDQNGALWLSRREVQSNQFQLAITVSLYGVTLAYGALPLDRVASAEGERQMLALVETLAETSVASAKAVKTRQKAMAKEAEDPEHMTPAELGRLEVDRTSARSRGEPVEEG
jgi:hypothetical protein